MTSDLDSEAQRLAAEALALRQSHPQAPALDVLLLVFNGRQGLRFPMPGSVDSPLTGPRSAFGQVIAAAFDQGMTPEDWLAMTGPRADPKLVAALLQIWCTYVLPSFAARFGCLLT
jgi:hypothetical protein